MVSGQKWEDQYQSYIKQIVQNFMLYFYKTRSYNRQILDLGSIGRMNYSKKHVPGKHCIDKIDNEKS